jgi:hypothetical protein
MRRVSLKGSRGTTFEIPDASWQAALEAARSRGWRWNINGGNVISKVDANLLSRVLRQAGRNGDGWPYLCGFLKDNQITVE